jgi:HEAT repeat protein
MNCEKNLTEYLKIVESGDATQKIELIDSLLYEEVPDNLAKMIISLINYDDRGVANSISMFAVFNPNPNIGKFLVPFISSADIFKRNLAGDTLIKMGAKSVPFIIEYLENRNDDDIKFLIDVAGMIGDPMASPKTLEILKVNKNANVILACVEALGNLKYEESIPQLITVYDMDAFYRPTVIEAMGKIGSKEALDFMVLMYDKEDEITKFSIIESLGKIGDEGTFFFLLSELGNTSGPLLHALIGSMFELKLRYDFDIPFDERMKSAILKTITEGEPQYKKAAVHLITVFDDKETIQTCLKIYGEDPELDETIKPKFFENPQLIYPFIAEILKNVPRNVQGLLSLLKEILEYESMMGSISISGIDLRDFTDSFVKCLESPDEEVRKLSIELLFGLNINTAILFLDQMVQDDDIWNKLKILEYIENINHPNVEKALRILSSDEEQMVSERASAILSQRNSTLN